MGMWQQLLERFVPLMDDDVSALDRRDGVGGSAGLDLNIRTHAPEHAAPMSRSRTAYKGSISPLPS